LFRPDQITSEGKYRSAPNLLTKEREREGEEFDDTFISASIVEFPSPFVGWQINDDPDI
jgi:hypothetical protein